MGIPSWQEVIGLAAVLAMISGTIWVKTARPYYPTLNGADAVPTHNILNGYRHTQEEDGRVKTDVHVGRLAVPLPELVVRDNVVYVDDKKLPVDPTTGKPGVVSTTSSGWHYASHTQDGQDITVNISASRNRYLADPFTDRLDLGTFAGYLRSHDPTVRPFDVGVRIGLIGFFEKSVRCDLAISGQAAGVGISIHPPADLAPGYLSHLGVGYYRVIDYHHHEFGNCISLCFSTQ